MDCIALKSIVNYNVVMNMCSAESCDRKVKGLGYCEKHYRRLRKHGNINTVLDGVTKHGMHKHPLYSTWQSMRTRCSNPNAVGYKNYGGKGIKVCDRWNDFSLFVKDMGDKPTPKHTLDRVDNSKNYTPENCRWATRSEQTFNQKSPSLSGYKGVYRDRYSWIARTCKVHGTKHLGSFKEKSSAVQAVSKICKLNGSCYVYKD